MDVVPVHVNDTPNSRRCCQATAPSPVPRDTLLVMEEGAVERFTRGDRVMVFTRSGREDGPTFVLVHGIGMGHRVFQGLADELGTNGTVLAVDLPGFGDSPEPDDALSIPATADFLAEFIEWTAREDIVLIGHSMGTQVVAEVLVRHPALARSAVLIAPTVNPAERTAWRQALRMAQDLIDESPRVIVLGMIQYAKAGPRWFLRKLRFMLDHRVEDILPSIRTPTLVIRGEKDPVCPGDWVARVAREIPDAVMREVPDRGHEAMIRSPHPVAAMITEHVSGASSPPHRDSERD